MSKNPTYIAAFFLTREERWDEKWQWRGPQLDMPWWTLPEKRLCAPCRFSLWPRRETARTKDGSAFRRRDPAPCVEHTEWLVAVAITIPLIAHLFKRSWRSLRRRSCEFSRALQLSLILWITWKCHEWGGFSHNIRSLVQNQNYMVCDISVYLLMFYISHA
jgi:hypothetical protein